MANVDKLVETLNQALQKAGGEATRIWPQMVEAWKFSSGMSLIAHGGIALVSFLLAGVAFRLGYVASKDNDGDASMCAACWGLFFSLFGVIIGGLGLSVIPDYVYPEVYLLKSLIGK